MVGKSGVVYEAEYSVVYYGELLGCAVDQRAFEQLLQEHAPRRRTQAHLGQHAAVVGGSEGSVLCPRLPAAPGWVGAAGVGDGDWVVHFRVRRAA